MKVDQSFLEAIQKERPLKELLDFSIIVIDKPVGPTSFTVSHHVKELLGLKKTGHIGTLDAGVSGVLPVALGRASTLAQYLQGRKKYVGIMKLHATIDRVELEKKLKEFTGKIKQLPPVRSNVRRQERVREIYQFYLLELVGTHALFETEVEAGTYIRKLIHDLGEKISGAHMLELRRIQAGIFSETKSSTLYELEEALLQLKEGNEQTLRNLLIPGEIIGMLFPTVTVTEEGNRACLQGSPLFARFLTKDQKVTSSSPYVVVFHKNQFIGCYKTVMNGDTVALPLFVKN